MPGPKKLTDDARIQNWLSWYDRNQQRSDYRRQRYAQLTEEQRETRRQRRKELYAQRVKEGWERPYRRKRHDIITYKTLLVAVLLQRDGKRCGICGGEMESGQESIDHIIPKGIGGTDSAENIRLAHMPCNNRRPKKPADLRLLMDVTQDKPN